MRALLRYLILPDEVTEFEARYLRRLNRIALIFFWAHLPAFMVIAAVNRTGAAAAALLTAMVLVGPTIAIRSLAPRKVSLVYGFTAMCMGGLLVHFGQGMVQIEMHFYFFVLLALLAVFGHPMSIIVAAVTVAVHHAILWAILPSSVFNYGAPFWVVGVHATFVILESVAAVFVARSFFDNVIGLEKIVAARTRELDQKNRDMRLILDTVEQGFVTVFRDGHMARERSAILDRWFGVPVEGQLFFDWLAGKHANFAGWLRLAFEAIFEDVLPLEVCLAQIPRHVVIDGRHFELDCRLLADQQAGLFVFSDVTARIEAERAETSRQEMAALVEHLVRDRTAVAEFIGEGSRIVDRLAAGDTLSSGEARRLVHTLKGNSSFFGMRRLVASCHEIEGRMLGDGEPLADQDVRRVTELWSELVARVRPFLDDDERIEVSWDDVEHLRNLKEAGASPAEMVKVVEGWREEPARRRLGRLAEQAKALASRLQKPIQVEVCGDDHVRLPDTLRSFWQSCTHVVRNAIDHGVEDLSARSAAGKPNPARLTFSTHVEGSELIVRISDDGRGINWPRVAELAKAMGLRHATPDDLREAIFADGLSTKADVTEISGRGIGMAAVLQAVRAHGGQVQVDSEIGLGTTVTFRFPRDDRKGLHPPRTMELAGRG